MNVCETHAELTRAVVNAEIVASGEHRDIDLEGLERVTAEYKLREARISRARHVMLCATCLDNIRAEARAEMFGQAS